MARPILVERPKRDAREELRARLEHAPAEHAEALLAGYDGQPQHSDRIVEQAFEDVVPLEDRFADAEYRLQLGRTMLRRALADAAAVRP